MELTWHPQLQPSLSMPNVYLWRIISNYELFGDRDFVTLLFYVVHRIETLIWKQSLSLLKSWEMLFNNAVSLSKPVISIQICSLMSVFLFVALNLQYTVTNHNLHIWDCKSEYAYNYCQQNNYYLQQLCFTHRHIICLWFHQSPLVNHSAFCSQLYYISVGVLY